MIVIVAVAAAVVAVVGRVEENWSESVMGKPTEKAMMMFESRA